MVLKITPKNPTLNTLTLRNRGQVNQNKLSIVGTPTATDQTEAKRRSTLPREQKADPNAQLSTPAGFAASISSFLRSQKKPVMAVMMGVTALPMLASGVAHATTTDNETAGDAGDATATTERAPLDVETAPTVAPDPAFDASKLKSYPLFKLFWNSPEANDGTSHEGLDEVTPAGVDKLIEYAKTHTLDGTEVPAGQEKVSAAETDLIKAVLEHSTYGTFFELDALPKLFQGFGIEANTVHPAAESAAEARAALAKAMGMSPTSLKLNFHDAGPKGEANYFSMDGAMAGPMSKVDLYREAIGQPKKAEAFEKAPVLNYFFGLESGHTKHGSFNESKPFSTSGLNWGVMMFPGDQQVKDLPVKSGFEFPIDFLTGFERPVGANPGSDRIVAFDKDGNQLSMEKVIQKDADGKAVSWSATFKNAAGEEVAPGDVTGRIKSSYGSLKGDGKTAGSMNMGWWGFCDRNTAIKLYKSKFDIPNIDRDVKIEVNGKFIEIPKADAQKLLDIDMTDMAGWTRSAGYRFNDEPQTIRMKNGSSITGKVQGFELRMGPGATRGSQDHVTVKNVSENPIMGSIEIENSYGSKSVIDLGDVQSITKNPETNEVEISTIGSSYTQKGKLISEISFDGATTNADGKLVLENTADKPIKGGELVINMGAGETKRVKASDVKSVEGEMQTEMSITEYVKFIADNDGMYATDNSKAVIVSNGMRWINKVQVELHESADAPEWAEGKTLYGTQGNLKRQEGDKLMHINGVYKTEYSSGLSSNFSGWVQVNAQGRIINEGFLSGEPDFAWAANGPINWNASSSFNKYMVPEMRMKILVNGISDITKLESAAERLNLPSNWKSLRLADAPAEAPAPTTSTSTGNQ